MRLIDADALLTERKKNKYYHLPNGDIAIPIIDVEHAPTVQPETAKRIVGKSRDGMTLWYQCDMCNEPVNLEDSFCSGCGRRLTDG